MIEKLIITIILLLFSIDLSTYLANYISVPVLKTLVYLTTFIFYLVFIIRFKNCKTPRHSIIWKLVIVYLILLFIRLFVDFSIQGIYFFLYKSPFTLYFFFLNMIILPLIFFYKYRVVLNMNKFMFALSILLFICMFCTVYNILNGNVVIEKDRLQANDSIDTIYYGHLGVSLAIVGVCMLKNNVYKLLSILSIVLGALSVVLSGSRGPIFAFVVCLLLFMFIGSQNKKKFFIRMFGICFFAYFLLEILNEVNDYLQGYDITTLQRIVYSLTGEEDISSGRNDIFANGLSIFLDNPILGKSYLLSDGSYVHNVFIEQFMALGIVGGMLFLIFNIKALIVSYKLMVNYPKYSLVSLLFIQYLLFGVFSRTIVAIPQYWLALFLILNLYDNLFLSKKYGK